MILLKNKKILFGVLLLSLMIIACVMHSNVILREIDAKARLALYNAIAPRFGYIDSRDNLIVNFGKVTYGNDSIRLASNFVLGSYSEGYARITRTTNGKILHYFYVNKLGEQIGPELFMAGKFTDGCAPAAALTTKRYGFIGHNGQWKIEPTYANVRHFCGGLAAVEDCETKLWGYISPSGKLVIPCKFPSAFDFNEGLAAVQTKGKYGYIDRVGKFVVDPSFDRAGNFSDGLAAVEKVKVINGSPKIVFSYLDKNGVSRISYQVDDLVLSKVPQTTLSDIDESESGGAALSRIELATFRCGLAIRCIDGKFGFIKKDGSWAILPKFTKARPFVNGFARITLDRQFQNFIDTDGKLMFPNKFKVLSELHEGLAAASENGLDFGFIRVSGSYQIEPRYQLVGNFSEGKAPVVELNQVIP